MVIEWTEDRVRVCGGGQVVGYFSPAAGRDASADLAPKEFSRSSSSLSADAVTKTEPATGLMNWRATGAMSSTTECSTGNWTTGSKNNWRRASGLATEMG